MAALPQRGHLDPQRAADLGALVTTATAVLLAPAVAGGGPLGQRLAVGLVLAAVAACGSAAAARSLPWGRWNQTALLAWPMLMLVGLTLAGLLVPASYPRAAALEILPFFYAGLTQRRRTGLLLLPLALCCWLAWHQQQPQSHLFGLVEDSALSVLVCEVLARLQADVGRLTRSLEERASVDPLTGLATRLVLDERLTRLEPGDAVIIVDLDHFKAINDRLGHAGGDRVLAKMGRTARHAVRAGDLAARFGGDEIVLVLTGSDREGASAVLERIRHRWHMLEPGSTFSAGACVMPADGDPRATVRAADQALYAAKRAGRDCWRFSTDPVIDLELSVGLATGA